MNYKIENKTINEIKKMIENKELYLKPDINSNESDLSQLDIGEFDEELNTQRALIWNNKSIQSLIKTILLKRIIPTIILNYNPKKENFQYSIIDGKQRLNSIWMFLNNKFAFKDSDNIVNANLNKKNFIDFPNEIINDILSFKIPVMIVEEKNKDILKKIFESLNTNSTKLKPQEIRHAIYHNDLTKTMNNFHKKSSKTMNSIIDLSINSTLFNKAKILNRSLDEFIVKLIRLWVKGEILDDGKGEIDSYYKENDFKLEDFNENMFFSLLKKTFEFFNLLQASIPKEIKKPVLIYIIFYGAINKKIDLNNHSKKNIEAFKDSFNELVEDKDLAFINEIRNQNQKRRREKMIDEFFKVLDSK